MGRRFQSGHSISFPVPTILNGTDGGPRTVIVVGKCNTTAYQAVLYTRSTGAHGWWFELDSTGSLHANYGTGTTARNVCAVGTAGAEIWAAWKDNGGTFHPFGRRFSGASFATDGGDVDSGSTLVDGTAIDTTWPVTLGRWGNTGSDYADDVEVYYVQVSNSVVSSASIAAAAKTKAGLQALGFDYWISCEGSTVTDSAGGTPTIVGTTTVSDPSGFFASGLTQALPVVTDTTTAQTFARSKSGALPVLSHTTTAQTLGRSKAKALPVLSHTTTAQTIVGSKSGALGRPGETDAAQTLARSKAGLLPRVSTTDAAQTFARSKAKALPILATTDVAQALAGAKRKALPVVTETTTAQEFGTPEGGLVQALPVVIDTTTARPFVGSKFGELPPAYEYTTAVLLAGGVPERSVMQLGAIMEELAARLRLAPSLAGRTFAYPPAQVKAPAAIVTYPTDIDYDKTYGRGMDQITGEVVIVVGRPTERQTRDRITKYADGAGAESVKALLDGEDYTSCDTVRVKNGLFDTVTIGGVDYLAAVFSIDIAGRGA